MKKQRVNYFLQRRVPIEPDGFVRPIRAVPHAMFLDKELIPTIRMTEQAHGKMMALIQECPIEIGWLSSCERDGGEFLINDVFVPHQECTMASTRITKDGMANLLNELRANEAGKEAIRTLLCWGHSHVEMEVFASSIDEHQTEKLLIEHRKQDHYIRLIGNKRGDMFASVYFLDQKIVVHHPNLLLPKIENTNRWMEWAKQEIAGKVAQETISFENFGELELNLNEVNRKTLDSWLKAKLISHELYDDILNEKEAGVVHEKPRRF
jgi:hypothetical protein